MKVYLNSKIPFEINVKICSKKINFAGSNDYKTKIIKVFKKILCSTE
jgi:hypothetical protein